MTLPAHPAATDRIDLCATTLLDRYLVQDVIAHGGMSVVYRGLDQRLLRPVCIKVFDGLAASSAPAYSTGHDHFVQEAFALSRLSHPNTVRIYDFGFLPREPALPFQISEWVDGGTLHARVKKGGALGLADALAVLEPIAGALAEAHAHGIVHRDVKPSNILLVDGAALLPKLADFGIAKAAARAVPHGVDTALFGVGRNGGRILLYSPGWSAPEQLRSEEVTSATDVFAFGLLAGYLLHGRALLPSGVLMRLVQAAGDLDGALAHALGEAAIAPSLAVVIAQACRNEASRRHQTIEDAWLALAAAARAPHPIVAAAPSPVAAAVAAANADRSPHAFIAGGRPVRVVETDERFDFEHAAARLRLSLLGAAGGALRLHVKGVNCFVARGDDGRPTGAVSLERDDTLRLLSPERRLLGVVRCRFDDAPGVLLDFEGRGELLLLQQAKGP